MEEFALFLANIMNYTNLKSNLVRRILGVSALIVTVMSVSAPAAQAWSLPSWLAPFSRLALANEDQSNTAPSFVIPQDAVTSKPVETHVFNLSAYTSSVEECDSDPFTTADGSTTHDGVVATNILPFGTKLRIPSLFGDKIFEVHDRMNTRYNNKYNLDIWMSDKTDMRQFGRRDAVVEIVQMGDGKTQWGKKVAAK